MLGKVKIAVWDTKGNLVYENDREPFLFFDGKHMVAAIEKLEGQTSAPALLVGTAGQMDFEFMLKSLSHDNMAHGSVRRAMSRVLLQHYLGIHQPDKTIVVRNEESPSDEE